MQGLRYHLARALIAVLVAGSAFVLLAPLGCEAALEIVETGPDIAVEGSGRAGTVRCTRLLLPDYEGPGDPARWPTILAAAALGALAASLIRPPAKGSTEPAPPPGDTT